MKENLQKREQAGVIVSVIAAIILAMFIIYGIFKTFIIK